MPDYPLSEKCPEICAPLRGCGSRTSRWKPSWTGRSGWRTCASPPEALELQAQVAEAAARPQLAENLRRAAELVAVPEETILEIYRALRPGRAGRESLYALGGRTGGAVRGETLRSAA